MRIDALQLATARAPPRRVLPATTLQRADALAVERERLRERARRRTPGASPRRSRRTARRRRRCRRRSPGRRCRGTAPGRAPCTTSSTCRPLLARRGRRRSGCGSRRAARRSCRPASPSSAPSMPSKSRPRVVGVVVGVGLDREAGAFEQRAVVLPARVADPDLRVRARCCCRKSAPTFRPPVPPSACTVTTRPVLDRRAVGAEHQRLHGLVVGGDAVDRQVAARRARSRRSSLLGVAARTRAAAACRCRRSRRRRRGSPCSGSGRR